MMNTKQMVFSKDVASKKINVVREFDASVEQVWQAWTDSSLLDLWWAPKPWQARTKTMNFKVGGYWLYAMVGPDGSTAWCKVEFQSIVPQKAFSVLNGFCDENGNLNHDFPTMEWTNTFSSTATGTKVEMVISFTSEEDLNKIIEMGFEQGFTAALGNLDELLAK